MIFSDDLLMIEKVCRLYNIKDNELVDKLKKYLADAIETGDSDSLRYDIMLDELNEYAGSLLFDEYFNVNDNFINDNKSYELLYKSTSVDLRDTYWEEVKLRNMIVNILILRHKKYIIKTIIKYIKDKDNSSLCINDLFSAAVTGILGAMHLDSSYFAQNMINKIDANIRDSVKNSLCDQVKIDNYIDLESILKPLSLPESVENIYMRDKLREILNDEEYLIIMLKFGLYGGKGYSLREIAYELSRYKGDDKIISKEAVSLRIDRILQKLKVNFDQFTNCESCDKFSYDIDFDFIFEKHNKILASDTDQDTIRIINRHRLNHKLNRNLTLYEYLNCSLVELYSCVYKISKTELNLLRSLYGEHLDQPYIDIDCDDEVVFCEVKNKIYRKLIDLLDKNSSKDNLSKSLIKK